MSKEIQSNGMTRISVKSSKPANPLANAQGVRLNKRGDTRGTAPQLRHRLPRVLEGRSVVSVLRYMGAHDWTRAEAETVMFQLGVTPRPNTFSCQLYDGQLIAQGKAPLHDGKLADLTPGEVKTLNDLRRQAQQGAKQTARANKVKARARNTAGQRKFRLPDEVPAEYREGHATQVFVNRYERDRKARRKCIDMHGSVCCVPGCGFDFGEVYGAEAKGYIHVHHRRSLAKIGREYKVDPIKDLLPVCPNCHAMLHMGGKDREIDDVSKLLAQAQARAVPRGSKRQK